ncbi:MAG: hypothetical protein WCC03_02350 [Candidatus Acidiferrales bacterium]
MREPQTIKELFAKPRKFQALYNRVTQVPAEIRSGATLLEAARRFGVTPAVVIDAIPSAFRKGRNGKYEVKPSDDLLRVLLIPARRGLREIVVQGSREASIVGQYWSAVEKFLKRGDASGLRKLPRKTVTDASGERIRLLTNLEELERQASAGVLYFESLYGRTR